MIPPSWKYLEELISTKKVCKEDLIDYYDYLNKKEEKQYRNESNYGKQTNIFFNTEDFKVQGKKMVDMICELYDNIENYPVQPTMEFGDLKNKFSKEPPKQGISIEDIMNETKNTIMPAVTQWQHPKFFAFYPSSIAYPSVIADIFASTFHAPGFTWNSSPAHSELEYVITDWVAKMLHLPGCFLHENSGGGSISLGTSESFHLTSHAAKVRKINELRLQPDDPKLLKFSAYTFEHTFATVEKALRLKDIHHIANIPVFFDQEIKNFQPDLNILEDTIENDLKEGLIPFYICATFGTTSTCANDPLGKIIKLAKKDKMWVNLDSAYSGTSWVCPEFELNEEENLLGEVDSLQINFGKLGMVGKVGSLIYVKDKTTFTQAFKKDKIFEIAKNVNSLKLDFIDPKDWMVGFSRRWNSLKFFFNIKSFGVEGYQHHIRSKVALSIEFQNLIQQSGRFELFAKPKLTLTTFRLKNTNDNQDQNLINEQLKIKLDRDSKQGYITPGRLAGTYFLRFVVCNHNTTSKHVLEFWDYLNKCADELIEELNLQ